MADIAQQLAAMQGSPPAKTLPGIFSIFGGPIARPQMQSLGFFTGQIGGPFGIKAKGGSPQMQYEQQRMATMKQEADSALAQACAAAGPISAPMPTGNIFEGNGLGGFGRGGGSFIDFA